MRRRTLGLPLLLIAIASCCIPAARAQLTNAPVFGGPATAGGRQFVSEGETAPPTMHPLTEEYRVITSRGTHTTVTDAPETPAKAENASSPGASSDQHVKRSGFVQFRRTRIHPQPNLRHASAEYERRAVLASAAEIRIRDTLRMPLKSTFDFQETPLRAVISQLQDEFNIIPIVPDMQALTDAGIDLDAMTFTQKLQGISLRSALRLLLREHGLTYLIKDETLLVTTSEKAQENLPFMLYPIPGRSEPRAVIDLIQSTISAETWDTVGGQGVIKLLDDAAILAIAQTEEVHEEIAAFLAALDGDLGPPDPGTTADPKAMPTRVYPIRDDKTLQELQKNLISLCNTALGAAGDSEARVTAVAGKLVVQSGKRGFHVYAGEMIHAFNGIDVTTSEYLGVSGDSAFPAGNQNSVNSGMNMMGPGMMGGGFGGSGSFCWVAREVYGVDDPRWLVFRAWMLKDAPTWLRDTYIIAGPHMAMWVHGRPAARAALRWLMDTVVEPRFQSTRIGRVHLLSE